MSSLGWKHGNPKFQKPNSKETAQFSVVLARSGACYVSADIFGSIGQNSLQFVITPQQFKQSWERVNGDRLMAFPESSFSDVQLPEGARTFLVEAGLPEEAAPFLNFEPPKEGQLERVSTSWHQPPAFDRYRIVGSNGSGDPICLDEQSGGEVVYLNHDNRFQRVLMASSVFILAECLLQFRDLIADAGGDTELIAPACAEEFLERLRTIDPATCGENGYWREELRSMQPAENKKWWRFWR